MPIKDRVKRSAYSIMLTVIASNRLSLRLKGRGPIEAAAVQAFISAVHTVGVSATERSRPH